MGGEAGQPSDRFTYSDIHYTSITIMHYTSLIQESLKLLLLDDALSFSFTTVVVVVVAAAAAATCILTMAHFTSHTLHKDV